MLIHGAGRLIDPVKELSGREQIIVEEAVKQLKVDIKLVSGSGLERPSVDFSGGKYELHLDSADGHLTSFARLCLYICNICG